MQTAKELAPARKDQQPRGNDTGTPPSYKLEGKKAPAAAEQSDAPGWDEV